MQVFEFPRVGTHRRGAEGEGRVLSVLVTCPKCEADLIDENCPACDGPFVELVIEVGEEPEDGVEFDVVALTEEEQALLRHSPNCTCASCDKSLEAQAVPRSPDRLFRVGLAAMLGFENPEAAPREAVLAAVRTRLKRIADLERRWSEAFDLAQAKHEHLEAIAEMIGAGDFDGAQQRLQEVLCG